MLKMGKVTTGRTLNTPYGPKVEPLITAPPAPAKPEIVTCGKSNAFATPICAFADTSTLFRPADVRPPRKEFRRKPRWHRRGRDLLVKGATAPDGPGIPSEQDVDEILGLLDLTLDLRDRLRRAVEQRLGLAQVEDPGHTAVQPGLHQVAGLLPRGHGTLGDFQREVQGPEVR